MPAFIADHGMPSRLELMAADADAMLMAHERMLGWEHHEVARGLLEARKDGMTVARVHLILRAQGRHEGSTLVFHADDVRGTAERAIELGCEVAAPYPGDDFPWAPEDEDFVILQDPFGGTLGLERRHIGPSFLSAGEPGTPVWFDYACPQGVDPAIGFFHDLFGWDVVVDRGGDVHHATAMRDGAPFLGICGPAEPDPRSFRVGGPRGAWSSILGVEDLEEAVAAMPDGCGEFLEPPTAGEFGMMSRYRLSGGLRGILAEVEPAPDECELNESDDILQLMQENSGVTGEDRDHPN